MDKSALAMWVVYENPSDFPGKFVVREWRTSAAGIQRAVEPTAVVDSLAQAREAVTEASPMALTVMPRNPEDDPTIVEVWL